MDRSWCYKNCICLNPFVCINYFKQKIISEREDARRLLGESAWTPRRCASQVWEHPPN